VFAAKRLKKKVQSGHVISIEPKKIRHYQKEVSNYYQVKHIILWLLYCGNFFYAIQSLSNTNFASIQLLVFLLQDDTSS
jgi:5-methylcytosine-specific restriction endonuclease McrBC regulatory subunit McrC